MPINTQFCGIAPLLVSFAMRHPPPSPRTEVNRGGSPSEARALGTNPASGKLPGNPVVTIAIADPKFNDKYLSLLHPFRA